jgi:hypothetical protein
MGFRWSRGSWIFFSIVVLLWGNIAAASSEGSGNSEITVLVHNSARISTQIVDEAELDTSRVFRAAGIAITWVNCSGSSGSAEEACHGTLGPRQFVLQIVTTGKTSSDLVFGVAFLDELGAGKYSDVFFDRIEQASRTSGTDVSRLLGAVAAHELGHLLLGNHAHSYVGVMTSVWRGTTLRYEDMGCLFFTPQQGSMMRARIASAGAAQVYETSAGRARWKFGRLP